MHGRYLAGTILVSLATTILASLFIVPRLERTSVVGSLTAASIDSGNIVDVAKRANPAVVAITISKNIPTYDKYYSDFFGLVIPQLKQSGTVKQDIGGGSGFLVSSDGYIVTNYHVVDDTTASYTVFTNDGKSYPAQVVDRDENLDVAVVKIAGTNFAYLPFGDSDKLEVGESVVAIGNALAEFRNTVSSGIVSGLSRSITASADGGGDETLDKLIQTDAAINLGNSGGPLLDLTGRVVGVNVAVASDAQNIGFAIPANSVKQIVDIVKK